MAAIATIKVRVVAANWQPLLILIVAGTIWTMGCVLFIAPRIFCTSWFERAIAEFGQATGVTATGLMLLRTVDPENRTPAAMSFGYKRLLHEAQIRTCPIALRNNVEMPRSRRTHAHNL